MNDRRAGREESAVDPRTLRILEDVADALDRRVNVPFNEPSVGFMVAVFPFDDAGGRVSWISNMRREDIAPYLAEQLRQFADA